MELCASTEERGQTLIYQSTKEHLRWQENDEILTSQWHFWLLIWGENNSYAKNLNANSPSDKIGIYILHKNKFKVYNSIQNTKNKTTEV